MLSYQFIFIKYESLKNIHPGEILLKEFLEPLQLSAYRLSKDTRIPLAKISETVKCNRRITAEYVLRLSEYYGNPAKFWLALQYDFNLEEELLEKYKSITSFKAFSIKAV